MKTTSNESIPEWISVKDAAKQLAPRLYPGYPARTGENKVRGRLNTGVKQGKLSYVLRAGQKGFAYISLADWAREVCKAPLGEWPTPAPHHFGSSAGYARSFGSNSGTMTPGNYSDLLSEFRNMERSRLKLQAELEECRSVRAELEEQVKLLSKRCNAFELAKLEESRKKSVAGKRGGRGNSR